MSSSGISIRSRRKGISTSIFLAAVVSVIMVALVTSALIAPSLTSSTTVSSNPGGATHDTQTTTNSSGVTPASPMDIGCVTVVPYDSMQKEFGGCGYTFAVLYNGDDYTQKLPNGTLEANSGWTLLVEVGQSCGCGPSENVSVGWDPAGPGSSTLGERLPVPATSTLMNGNLTVQWRLYGSTVPLLYAWIIGSSLASSPQQTTSTASNPASCSTTSSSTEVSASYQDIVQQIEENPAFLALTDGLCYSFTQNYSGESGGLSLATFVFSQYDGTVFYPCGTFPENLTLSQIQVTVFNGTAPNEIDSMWLDNQTASLNVFNCPASNDPLLVESVLIVPPYTPAGPTVEVTLRANLEQGQITNLTAVLALTGREPFQSQTETFGFLGVNSSDPLSPGASASQNETIVGPVAIYSDYIYSMNISGTFQNGQTFSYPVQVEIQNSPSTEVAPEQAPASCLKEVPENATIAPWTGNSTYPAGGETVTYTNGTEVYFAQTECPQPLKPDLFAIASTIESDPRFIVAENSTRAFWELGGQGFSNGSGDFATYIFDAYTNQILYPCGGTTRWVTISEEIQVITPASGATGSPDLSHLQIDVFPPDSLNIFTCTDPATSASQTA